MALDEVLPSTVTVGPSFLRKKAISRKCEQREFTEHKRNSITIPN